MTVASYIRMNSGIMLLFTDAVDVTHDWHSRKFNLTENDCSIL